MKQRIKDFLAIQKEFFTEAFYDYFRPLKGLCEMVSLLFSIVFELPKQMFISACMSDAEYQELQDEKFRTEVREGLQAEKEEVK